MTELPQCKDGLQHDWKEIYHSPRDVSKTTRIEWCQECGTISEFTGYHEFLKHYVEYHSPRHLQKKSA